MTPDQVGVIVGAIFTLIILSYLIADNFLYRLATHILVGAGAAYILFNVAVYVLGPYLVEPIIRRQALTREQVVVEAIGLLLGALLLFKFRPRWAFLGNISVGYLVGVGAAVALGGALFGTLGPQIQATASVSNAPLANNLTADPTLKALVDAVVTVIVPAGAIFTLLSFGFYRSARGGIFSGINAIGRFFLAIALGATFALVYVASISLLIDRTQAVADAWPVVRLLLGLK